MKKISALWERFRYVCTALVPLLLVAGVVMTGARYQVIPRLLQEGCHRVLAVYIVLVGLVFLLSLGLAIFFWWPLGAEEAKGLQARWVRARMWFSQPTTQAVCLTITLGMIYMFVFPPMSSPDESAHFAQSYAYSNVIMGLGQWNETVNGEAYPGMRACDAEGLLYTRPGLDDWNRLTDSSVWVVGCKEMVSQRRVEALGGVFWSYLPQTLGITLGRILGLGAMPVQYLARMMNFLVYVFLFYAALKLLPFGKEVLGVIGCFPMTLHLVASMNYDACVLGLSFLFVAKVLQLAYEKERVTPKDMILLTLVMTALAPIKVIYALMALLCFMIPAEKFGSRKRYLCYALGMAGVVALVFLLVNIPRLIPYLQETNLDLDYGTEVTQCYTLKELLTSPILVLSLTFHTLRHYGSEHLVRMVGERLGWLEIPIPMGVIFGFFICLLYVSVMTEAEKAKPYPCAISGKNRAWSILVIGGVIFLAIFSMMAAWTPAGSIFVEGVQGRYYLPILPLAVLLVRSPNMVRRDGDGFVLSYGMVLLHIWAITEAFAYMIARLGYDVLNGVQVWYS